MKTFTHFLLIIFLINFLSCSTDDSSITENALTGEWKLKEVLMDPGDGSGVFTDVESDKIITFGENNVIASNGDLCDMSIESNASTTGIYSENGSYFTSPDCWDPEYQYQFQHSNNVLIVHYPCIEPCQAKYVKK